MDAHSHSIRTGLSVVILDWERTFVRRRLHRPPGRYLLSWRRGSGPRTFGVVRWEEKTNHSSAAALVDCVVAGGKHERHSFSWVIPIMVVSSLDDNGDYHQYYWKYYCDNSHWNSAARMSPRSRVESDETHWLSRYDASLPHPYHSPSSSSSSSLSEDDGSARRFVRVPTRPPSSHGTDWPSPYLQNS